MKRGEKDTKENRKMGEKKKEKGRRTGGGE